MVKLNFSINPRNDFLYDRVTLATTPNQERQWSPASPPRSRIRRAPFSETSAEPPLQDSCSPTGRNGSHNNNELAAVGRIINNYNGGSQESSVEMMRQEKGSFFKPASTYFETPQNGTYPTEDYSDASSHDESTSATDAEYSSNERLLLVAFVTFLSFSLTQLYFAFRAESEAMKGDSAAMIVDSFTYLFNWVAERRKHTFDRYYRDPVGVDPERAAKLRQRTKRKVILRLEILPPLVSVATLLVVTGIVLRHASKVIWLDLHRDIGEQSDPSINLMLLFSLINLGLDGVNFCCFARASHLFGYDTTEQTKVNSAVVDEFSSPDSANGSNGRHRNRLDHWMDEDETEQEHPYGHGHAHANLNMCSAYTHVFADTLRSVAVIIASALAELFDDVTAEEADAAAALVVSILILLSLVPLFQGLVQSGSEFLAIRAEERSEIMMEEIQDEERLRLRNGIQ